MNLELTDREAQVLRERLVSEFGDLRMEVSNTDSGAWRDGLKEDERTLLDVLGKLGVGLEQLNQPTPHW